jgi:hypothetical protein
MANIYTNKTLELWRYFMSPISKNVAEAELPVRTSPPPLTPHLQNLLDAATAETAETDVRFKAAHEFLTFGYIDKAREILNTLPASRKRTARTDRISQVEAGEALLQHVIPDIETQVDHQLGRKLTGIMVMPCAERTPFAVIMFGGNGDRNFTLPHQLINRNLIHFIFIRDSTRCFSLCEISRLGPDFDTNLSNLKQILAELEVTSVYCIGLSSGAFPALKFGLELEAISVLNFSGTPNLNIDEEPGATMAKYPQLVQLYKKARHRATSMDTEYAARSSHPSVKFLYGEKNKRDAYLAGLMPNVAGVTLVPLTGFAGHGTFEEAIKRSMLTPLLDELFSSKRVMEPAYR